MMRLLSAALLTLAAAACSSHVDRPNPTAAQVVPPERTAVAAAVTAPATETAATETTASSSAVETTASNQPADDEGVICRTETVTGSHFPVRICTTRKQREETRRASEELLRDTLRQPTSPGPVAGQGGN